MNGQQISLQTIDELRVEASEKCRTFFIPAYQRGFRWSPLQVTQLLEDIREFNKRRNPQPDEFYCLQPLVIKIRAGGDYEVVDGQQRLTTLLLILRHFNERLAERYRQKLFELQYETRPSLYDFLDTPSEEAANENVDYFHLYQAIQAIEIWFQQRASEVEAIKDTLLNKTKVIWFQLSDSDNPVEAFTRLNVGKIPLTNDELIRALFLRRSSFEEKEATNQQLRIAYEWDQMEKALQSNVFWYFLSNQPGKVQNRIGFLFELVAKAGGLASGVENDAYGIFYTFNQRMSAPGAKIENEWLEIKKVFMMLEEWFEDRVLYHMVGFLVSEGMDINSIRKLSENCTKSGFEQHLRSEIFQRAVGHEIPHPLDEKVVREHVEDLIDDLSYLSNPYKIRSTLLLFNLSTLLQNMRSNMRFQFDSFKSEKWDIEHIRSVTDDRPDRHHARRNWLGNCLEYLESKGTAEELCSEIKSFLKLSQVEATYEVFDPLYEKILDLFHEATEAQAEHGISNLTLLDERTNRSYKNSVFAVKRHRILTLDQAGIFVPICTRNVFLKCYNPHVDNLMFWSEDDRDGYEEAITKVLLNFFCKKMEGIQ